MSEPVITIDGIGKKYRLGMTLSPNTLRDHLTEGVRNLWSRARGRRDDGQAAPAAPAIEPADAARISGRDFWALKDVSFDVRRGEVVGIIGRNGAGKSTLLKILSRITAPTEGEIRIRGRVASLLEVGTGFHPELSGRENIFLNGAILGMARTEIRRKFDEIVAFSEIGEFIDTPVKRYSSGMYVRLAFAVAAHLEPEILIIDEVLAVGDAMFQSKCLGKMREVARGGRTVLFVSHNMNSVERLCETAIEIRDGRLYARGNSSEIVADYLGANLTSFESLGRLETRHFVLRDLQIGDAPEAFLEPLQPATVRIVVEPKSRYVDVGAHILIEDETTYPVLGLDSGDFAPGVPCEPGKAVTFKYEFGSLPLSPGSYRLRIWLRSAADGIADEVDVLFPIRVNQAPVYSHRPVSRRWHGTIVTGAKASVSVADVHQLT